MQQPVTHLQVTALAEQVNEPGQQSVEETTEGPITSI